MLGDVFEASEEQMLIGIITVTKIVRTDLQHRRA